MQKMHNLHAFIIVVSKRTIHIKLQACNFIKKETLAQVFSCEFREISKNTFFYRTPRGDCFRACFRAVTAESSVSQSKVFRMQSLWYSSRSKVVIKLNLFLLWKEAPSSTHLPSKILSGGVSFKSTESLLYFHKK